MHLNKLEEELKDLRIPLQEDDVLDLLQIRKRWPLKYPWGQYGVEILNSNGILVFPFYSYDGYFVYEEWKKYYDNGFMTVLNSVLDLTKELRPKWYNKPVIHFFLGAATIVTASWVVSNVK